MMMHPTQVISRLLDDAKSKEEIARDVVKQWLESEMQESLLRLKRKVTEIEVFAGERNVDCPIEDLNKMLARAVNNTFGS